jgi:hypothetical protein
VKIDLTGLARGGGEEAYPALGAFGAETDTAAGTRILGDLIEKGAAQLTVLRRAVDDAASMETAVRRGAGELERRLGQGQQFAAEFDQRLARAGQAAGVVEKAAVALGAMEGLIAQMRGAQDAMTRTFDAKLRGAQESMESRLVEQERWFTSRMQAQQEMFERRVAEMAAGFERAMEGAGASATRARDQFETNLEEHRKSLMASVEMSCAGADRHVAQAQARASLVLDGVSDRLDVLTQQLSRIGNEAQEHMDNLCSRAAALLGHDPRSDFAATPKPGSLADAASRADELVSGMDSAAIRLSAVKADAEAMIVRLNDAKAESERTNESFKPQLESVRETILAAMEEAERMRTMLDEAAQRQAAAIEKSEQSSTLLSRQREDLGAMAEAGRYHVEQCKNAESALKAAIDDAGAKSEDLRRQMDEVTASAARMVGFAREAATLVEKARETTPKPQPAMGKAGG